MNRDSEAGMEEEQYGDNQRLGMIDMTVGKTEWGRGYQKKRGWELGDHLCLGANYCKDGESNGEC